MGGVWGERVEYGGDFGFNPPPPPPPASELYIYAYGTSFFDVENGIKDCSNMPFLSESCKQCGEGEAAILLPCFANRLISIKTSVLASRYFFEQSGIVVLRFYYIAVFGII